MNLAEGKKAVSERALFARINRAIQKDDLKLCKSPRRALCDLGEYYTIDIDRNFIIDKYLDLEAYGREMGALKSHEELTT